MVIWRGMRGINSYPTPQHEKKYATPSVSLASPAINRKPRWNGHLLRGGWPILSPADHPLCPAKLE